MTKYLLINKKNVKVPLLATKSKPYQVKINDSYTASWNLMDEAWLVTNMYLLNKNRIARSLRADHPEIGPVEIEKFFEIVKTDHPTEEIDFKWDDVPVYATTDSYCELYLPWLYKHSIKLTLEQENDVLGIAKDDVLGKKERIIQWFRRYREKYGVDTKLKRDKGIQDEDLADMFCLVHGFELGAIDNCQSDNSDKKKSGIGGCLVVVFAIIASFGLLQLGRDSDSWLISILCAVPFLLILGLIGKFLGITK